MPLETCASHPLSPFRHRSWFSSLPLSSSVTPHPYFFFLSLTLTLHTTRKLTTSTHPPSEQIQHYGKLHDEEADRELTEPQALSMIEPLLKRVKKEYAVAEKWLKGWYEKENVKLA